MAKIVSNEAFVKAWLNNDTIKGVAEELGATPGSVSTRATKLRQAGVPLPPYRTTPDDIDVDSLTSLIIDEGDESEEAVKARRVKFETKESEKQDILSRIDSGDLNTVKKLTEALAENSEFKELPESMYAKKGNNITLSENGQKARKA